MEQNTKPRKRRLGDRKDGRRLRTLDPFFTFVPFIMKDRNDATNFFEDRIDIAAAEAYLLEKRQEGLKGVGMLHLFLTAYLRCVAKYPGLNRFVSGQRVYARNNIEVCLAVKRSLTIDGSETTIKVVLEPTDSIEEVYRKMNAEIDKIKSGEEENGTEKFAAAFAKFPSFLFRSAIRFLKLLDYYGLIPQAAINVSPFHGSFFITDLGSLGIPPIYHHLYNFGNVPIFLAFGTKYKERELSRDGTVVEKRYIDYKVTTDERTVDGLYYAMAFRALKHYMRNPHKLDEPVTVKEDID